MNYVNLGCGTHYHPDWINIDIVTTGPGVIAHDLSRGIPLSDNSCDVVYHSHVLEHLRREDGLRFLHECYRVLEPGGIIRVAVPDLETICRLYLEKLDACLSGEKDKEPDYEWMLLEMYDQTVRERSGGAMKAYLQQYPLLNEAFVYARIGDEARGLVAALKQQAGGKASFKNKLLRCTLQAGQKPVLVQGVTLLTRLYQRVAARFLLGKKAAQALDIGRFRLGGEVHQWMYDCFSLAQTLQNAGFADPVQRTAWESAIPNWNDFALDALPDGTIRKPDSLFMEATRLS